MASRGIELSMGQDLPTRWNRQRRSFAITLGHTGTLPTVGLTPSVSIIAHLIHIFLLKCLIAYEDPTPISCLTPYLRVYSALLLLDTVYFCSSGQKLSVLKYECLQHLKGLVNEFWSGRSTWPALTLIDQPYELEMALYSVKGGCAVKQHKYSSKIFKRLARGHVLVLSTLSVCSIVFSSSS